MLKKVFLVCRIACSGSSRKWLSTAFFVRFGQCRLRRRRRRSRCSSLEHHPLRQTPGVLAGGKYLAFLNFLFAIFGVNLVSPCTCNSSVHCTCHSCLLLLTSFSAYSVDGCPDVAATFLFAVLRTSVVLRRRTNLIRCPSSVIFLFLLTFSSHSPVPSTKSAM